MFIESGTMVFLSLVVMTFWLSRNTLLWLFGHAVWLELPFGLLAYALHYGTFSGMMAAAVACILCSAYTRAGRYLVGCIKHGQYHPGIVTLVLKS